MTAVESATSLPRFRRSQLLYLLVYIAIVVVAFRLLGSLAVAPEVAWTVRIGGYVALFGGGVLVFRDAFARSWRLSREHPWRTVMFVLLGLVALTLAEILGSLAYVVVAGAEPSGGSNESNLAVASDTVPLVLLIPVIGLLGPVVEELVFREALLWRQRGGRRGRIVTVAAVVISSLLFGVLHVHSLAEWPYILIYGLTGLALAAALLVSQGNLLIPIAVHVVSNSVAAFSMIQS